MERTPDDPAEDKEMPLRYGRDEKLEADADELLGEKSRRSDDRLTEKLLFEAGMISEDDLTVFDPADDWNTQWSAYTLYMESIDGITPSLCGEGDGNVRARAREDPSLPPGKWGVIGIEARKKLTRRTDDEMDWGSTHEDIPLLGSPGERKTCALCQRSKRLEQFSLDARGKRGVDNWCRMCRRERMRERRRKNREQ